jgi:hypothetical protein
MKDNHCWLSQNETTKLLYTVFPSLLPEFHLKKFFLNTKLDKSSEWFCLACKMGHLHPAMCIMMWSIILRINVQGPLL